ncbi:hypothetical protein GAH_00824 [Geoglobus ahangari]|uniref:Uncharacterized protein n=1 Tax=Geoglobus ahangari TaxID=113653 RepID=A0A0F7IIK7_9EURY|nr:hypothetical protein [Geoglobus ahangari]AKG91844.1 hypothetical protein GAH_00824 [Geoglobus ahangari]
MIAQIESRDLKRQVELELSTYFASNGILGSTFDEYLKVHRLALSQWDATTRKYRNGRFICGNAEYCVVFLKDVGFYVRWKRASSSDSSGEILVGKPLFDGKTWKISCFEPDESLLEEICEIWDPEKKRFENSIFLRMDGKMVWVYLTDLRICVGWVKGLGSKIFGRRKESKTQTETKPYTVHPFGLELRRKINNSYGCW